MKILIADMNFSCESTSELEKVMHGTNHVFISAIHCAVHCYTDYLKIVWNLLLLYLMKKVSFRYLNFTSQFICDAAVIKRVK